MPEPEIQIIEGICIPYSQNPKGIGIISHTDPTGIHSINRFYLYKGEIRINYWDYKESQRADKCNYYVDCYNKILNKFSNLSIPKFSNESEEYKKKIDPLKDDNLVYLEIKDRFFVLEDDYRSVFYKCNNAIFIFDVNVDTGIDIIDGQDIEMWCDNMHQDIRAFVYNHPIHGNVGIMWRSNEFPYKNMTILMDSKNAGSSVKSTNFKCEFKASYGGVIAPSFESLPKYDSKFKNQVLIRVDAPEFSYNTKQAIPRIAEKLILNNYLDVDFKHSQTDFTEDQKRILGIDYDGHSDDKSFTIFGPNNLRYKEIDIVYHNADLAQVKLDPECVAKSSKITLYAWNGQSPFPGKAELVVK